MKSAASRKIEPLTMDTAVSHLGPADVIEVDGGEVVVELSDGAVARATPAFAAPYAPAVGDVLLVIGRGGQHWAIGVIQGSGRTTLRFQGDVDLTAEGGAVRIEGDRGVEIRGPDLSVHADKIQVVAGAVVEKFTSLYQRVSDLLSVRAQRSHTVVDEASVTQAKSAAIVTEETVTINGREVHLG